jgi:hypothetical protein
MGSDPFRCESYRKSKELPSREGSDPIFPNSASVPQFLNHDALEPREQLLRVAATQSLVKVFG